jgi:hypothetical protein
VDSAGRRRDPTEARSASRRALLQKFCAVQNLESGT